MANGVVITLASHVWINGWMNMNNELAEAHERVLDRIEVWHESDSENTLIDFLNWTSDEYKDYLERNVLPEREVA